MNLEPSNMRVGAHAQVPQHRRTCGGGGGGGGGDARANLRDSIDETVGQKWQERVVVLDVRIFRQSTQNGIGALRFVMTQLQGANSTEREECPETYTQSLGSR